MLLLIPTTVMAGGFPFEIPDEAIPPGANTSWMPDWLNNLFQAVSDMLQTFKDLMSGKLIYDAVKSFIVMCIDEIMSPLFGAFAKSYLFTPQLAEINLVYKGWSVFMVVGLVALVLGAGWLGLRVIRGRKKLDTLLKVFLICLPLIYYSLTLLNVVNVLINWSTQTMLQGMIGTSGVQYQGLTGEQILKALVIGTEGITNSSIAAQSVGQVIVDTPGGVFTLIFFLVFVVLPLFIVSVFKTLILVMMAIFIPIWIAYTAFSGKIETMIGFANVYVRTLLVGLFCALHFGISVKMQTDYSADQGIAAELGVSPTIASILMVIGLLIFLYFFHLKSVWRALRDPVHLGGGKVIENVGKWGENASNNMNAIGKRMGSEGLQKRSLSMAEASRRMQATGKKMQSQQKRKGSKALSKLTKGASEIIQGVTYSAPTEWYKEVGTVVTGEEIDLKINSTEVDTSSTNMMAILQKEQGFTSAKFMAVPDNQKAEVQKELKRLDKRFKDNVTLTEKGLYITGEAKQAQAALEQLNHMGVLDKGNLQKGIGREGVFVNLEDRTIHVLDDYQETQDVLDKLKGELPTFSTLHMNSHLAKSLYDQVQADKKLPWAKEIKWDDHKGLQIPDDHLKEAKKYFEQALSNKRSSTRFNLPEHSKFLPSMLETWKSSGQYTELVKGIEAVPKKNYIYVPQELKETFVKAYAEYRKDKTPYWRTKDGKVTVVIDGMPVNHGSPPLNGLDMGDFDAFQREMLEGNQKSKSKKTPSQQDNSKEVKTSGTAAKL
jgi:hypothetical protein